MGNLGRHPDDEARHDGCFQRRDDRRQLGLRRDSGRQRIAHSAVHFGSRAGKQRSSAGTGVARAPGELLRRCLYPRGLGGLVGEAIRGESEHAHQL